MAILLQKDCAFIILENHIVHDRKLLTLYKMPGPQDQSHGIIHPHQFSLSGAPGVNSLLKRDGLHGATTQGHCSCCVTFHLPMHCI